MEKTVKVIKDFTGTEHNALVVIGRVAIVQNGIGKYVKMFCDKSSYVYGAINIDGWTFGSGSVMEYSSLQDACNSIHPQTVI